MSNTYSLFERRLAQFLDRFPTLRQWAKWSYKRLNYLYHGTKSVTVRLHPQATLQTPAEWSRAESHNDPEFFGYYDKTPWSPDGRQLLLQRRRGADILDLLIYNRNGGRELLAQTRAWNYQQGSMAQWLPDGQHILFNDLEDRRLVARVVSLEGDEQVMPWPVQVLHPSGAEYLSLNYRRLYRLRAEYGYAHEADNFLPQQPLKDDGLWRVDRTTGDATLIISLAELAAHQTYKHMKGADHRVNHAVYAPDGKKFVFMHRWVGSQGTFSRLYAADVDGTNLRLLLDDRMVSHYTWDDASHLLTWARTEQQGDRYYRINVDTGEWTVMGDGQLDSFGDGHPSFSPDRRWIVTDTYPDRARNRHLLLFDRFQQTLIRVGTFFAPLSFDGPNRCDLHPRWGPDGHLISIDSAHEGIRKNYILNVSDIVREYE